MRRPSLFPLLILLASLSCTRPSSDEMYVSRERAEYGDTYPFELDFSDSLLQYGEPAVLVSIMATSKVVSYFIDLDPSEFSLGKHIAIEQDQPAQSQESIRIPAPAQTAFLDRILSETEGHSAMVDDIQQSRF